MEIYDLKKNLFDLKEHGEPFVYVMPDDSMAPVFEPNDYLTVDPTVQVKSGDFALVRLYPEKQTTVYAIRKVIDSPDCIKILPGLGNSMSSVFPKNSGFPSGSIIGKVTCMNRCIDKDAEPHFGEDFPVYTLGEIPVIFAGKGQQLERDNPVHWEFFSKNHFSEKQ